MIKNQGKSVLILLYLKENFSKIMFSEVLSMRISNEWTNYELAKKYLNQMLLPYEQLSRQHLYTTAKDILDSFDIRYPEWK